MKTILNKKMKIKTSLIVLKNNEPLKSTSKRLQKKNEK